MIGHRWLGWRFKGGTPLWFNLIAGLLILDSAVHVGLLSTVSTWAQPSRDAVHSHRVPFRNGVNYFVEPWLGRYLDMWWLGMGLLATLLLLLFLNRDRLERDSF